MTPLRRLFADRDRGAAAVEAAVGVPAFLLFLALIIFAGRVAIARQAVESAAADAARTASIARTQSTATRDGTASATLSLRNQQVQCATAEITLDTSGFATPAGQPATISATVTCQMRIADLALPGMAGTHTITATMTSPLDTYRER